MNIRELESKETIPYKLLLLADETIEGIDKYIFESTLYVAECEGKMLGVCAITTIDSTLLEIMNIAVGVEHRRKGVGTKLIQYAIDSSKQRGYKALLIGTADVAYMQLAFYRKMGFKDYRVRTNYFVKKYSEPIFEEGVQLRDMIVLKYSL